MAAVAFVDQKGASLGSVATFPEAVLQRGLRVRLGSGQVWEVTALVWDISGGKVEATCARYDG